MFDGLAGCPGRQSGGDVGVSFGIIRVEAQGLLVLAHGRFELALPDQGVCQVVVSLGILGFEAQGLLRIPGWPHPVCAGPPRRCRGCCARSDSQPSCRPQLHQPSLSLGASSVPHDRGHRCEGDDGTLSTIPDDSIEFCSLCSFLSACVVPCCTRMKSDHNRNCVLSSWATTRNTHRIIRIKLLKKAN